ncbi:MAG: TerC family protein [Deltaproteobacteria bacterium]|nr:TerC family protein [Deltaproteobacteria bacterium]
MTTALSSDIGLSLVSLTALEIVLGIDNIVFLSIIAGKLPHGQQARARRIGLSLALLLRITLLLVITWIMRLTVPLLTTFGHPFSGRDCILLAGGLFLVAKATHEIYDKLERAHPADKVPGGRRAFGLVLLQILLLDLVFSLDSVITAVGMATQVWVMITAMVVAVAIMFMAAGGISAFVNRHPSMKILGLSFLLLIGVLLIAEGMGQHISRGYIYFAMAFSLGVELLNIRLRKRHAPVTLGGPRLPHQRSATHQHLPGICKPTVTQ